MMRSAISHAAHTILSQEQPIQQQCFDAALAEAVYYCDSCQTNHSDITNYGQIIAQRAAKRVLWKRMDDGSTDFVDYQITPQSEDPFAWQPTYPDYLRVPLLPRWTTVKPFAIRNPNLHRQGPPPQFRTPEFGTAFDEVILYGRNDSDVRTYEQRVIAKFWLNDPMTETPPGHWHSILHSVLLNKNITDIFKISTIYRLLGAAVADGGIVTWDHKFF